MAQSKAFDSNAGQWPTFTAFEALTPNSAEIRVLELDGSSSAGDLEYSIHRRDLDTLPKWSFSALSYSWGAPVPLKSQKQISIEGQPVLIRPTLYWFLKTLANYDAKTSLWIDAVCINQADVEERNRQISMMGRIFGAAETVYVWIGAGDDDTNYIFEHMQDQDPPQTPFDPRQYNPCAEKLFRSSYWTRRWVIQEFALARELLIACGAYVIPWEKLIQKIDITVLENDARARATFENFNQLRSLSSQQSTNLLQTMLQFEDARCIDRRDKAFALRGIASDGEELVPDYKESVGDVYFRVLSQTPSHKVLPEMIGYRWPHRAASQLQECFPLTEDDILTSLIDKPSDKIFVAIEYIAEVASVNIAEEDSTSVRQIHLSRFEQGPIYAIGKVSAGDLIYSLQSSSRSPKGLFIAFSPNLKLCAPIGFVFDNRGRDAYKSVWKLMMQIVFQGFRRCMKNTQAKSQRYRVLCHMSRLAMIWLWLLDIGQERKLQEYFSNTGSSGNVSRPADLRSKPKLLCQCTEQDDLSPSELRAANHNDNDESLEILPAVQGHSMHSSWWATRHPSWFVEHSKKLSETLEIPDRDNGSDNSHTIQPDFKDNGRTDLSYAVEEGHVKWTEHLLSTAPRLLNRADKAWRTPISWAITGGHVETLRLLLSADQIDYESEERKWDSPLKQAVESNFKEAVELLLATGKIDPNGKGQAGRTALSHAAIGGHLRIVKILLAFDRTVPDEEDVDGKTPLLWAARHGRAEIARLLLDTKEVNYNAKDLEGRTPLSYAAEGGHMNIVKALLAQDNIEPDLMDNQRFTPLRWAAQGKNKKIFDLLLATGRVRNNVLYSHEK